MTQFVINGMVGMTMLIGIVGVLIPIIPGTLLIAGAFIVWAFLTGGKVAFGGLLLGLLILGLGQLLKYVIPRRSLVTAGVPNRSLLLGGLAGVAGFFLIPFVGLPLGFVGGVMAAEQVRLGAWPQARASTWVAMKAAGLSMMVELAAALLAVGVWATSAVAVVAA